MKTVIFPSPSTSTAPAIQNARAKRRCVQHFSGEVLTSENSLRRLETEHNEKRKELLQKNEEKKARKAKERIEYSPESGKHTKVLRIDKQPQNKMKSITTIKRSDLEVDM